MKKHGPARRNKKRRAPTYQFKVEFHDPAFARMNRFANNNNLKTITPLPEPRELYFRGNKQAAEMEKRRLVLLGYKDAKVIAYSSRRRNYDEE